MEDRKGDKSEFSRLLQCCKLMRGPSTKSLLHLKLTLKPPNPKIMVEKINSPQNMGFPVFPKKTPLSKNQD